MSIRLLRSSFFRYYLLTFDMGHIASYISASPNCKDNFFAPGSSNESPVPFPASIHLSFTHEPYRPPYRYTCLCNCNPRRGGEGRRNVWPVWNQPAYGGIADVKVDGNRRAIGSETAKVISLWMAIICSSAMFLDEGSSMPLAGKFVRRWATSQMKAAFQIGHVQASQTVLSDPEKQYLDQLWSTRGNSGLLPGQVQNDFPGPHFLTDIQRAAVGQKSSVPEIGHPAARKSTERAREARARARARPRSTSSGCSFAAAPQWIWRRCMVRAA